MICNMVRKLLVTFAVFAGIVIIVLSGNVIIIGDKLGEISHPYVEYVFYLLIFIIFFFYVVRPIIKMYRAPEFPILSVNDEWDLKQLQLFAKRLSRNCGYISDKSLRVEHQLELSRQIDMYSSNMYELKSVIEHEIALRMDGDKSLNVRGINNRIKEWGKTVFMVTAISQNSKVDSLSVLVMNHKMITDIVLASGFRPTRPQLFKIYVKVLTTALISYCTSYVFTDVDGVAPFDMSDGNDVDMSDASQDVDMEIDGDENGMLAIINNLRKSRIAGLLFDSAIEGCINALLTLRIGYVTKSYLTEGAQALSGTRHKRSIKRKAMLDSFKVMPNVILEGGVVLGGTVKKLLLSIFKK